MEEKTISSNSKICRSYKQEQESNDLEAWKKVYHLTKINASSAKDSLEEKRMYTFPPFLVILSDSYLFYSVFILRVNDGFSLLGFYPPNGIVIFCGEGILSPFHLFFPDRSVSFLLLFNYFCFLVFFFIKRRKKITFKASYELTKSTEKSCFNGYTVFVFDLIFSVYTSNYFYTFCFVKKREYVSFSTNKNLKL